MNCAVCNHELPDGAAFCPCCTSAVPGASECGDYVYEAFISYRHTHADRALARRVQRRIEGYRIPRELRKDGEKNLGKCFRDEDELPTSDSLPNLIERALRASRFLVVICSPRMRESRWVAREVELFAAYHGRDRILLALADGEPEGAFPPLLMSLAERHGDALTRRETEPVAADLRPAAKKRFSDEVLRILAPVVGCGYDDLRQRQRVRRLGSAVVGVGLVAAISAAFGGFALFQQAQIEANYEQALRNQSAYLAEEASTLLGQGKRTQAAQVALGALGADDSAASANGATSNARPYVPAARLALESSCQVYPGTYWSPLYTNEEPAGISDAFVSPDGSTYAVLLADESVCAYDVATGRALGTVAAPEGGYRMDVAICNEGILCLDFSLDATTLTLHDAGTGEALWSRELTWDASQLTPSPDGTLIATFAAPSLERAGAVAAVVSTQDGSAVTGPQELAPAQGDDGLSFTLPTNPAAFSADGATLAQSVGSSVWVLDMASGTWRQAPSGAGHITSALVTDTMVYLGCFDEKDTASECVICAFDLASLSPSWVYRAPATGTLAETYAPRLFEVDRAERGPGLLVSIGRDLLILDVASGEVDLSAQCPASVGTAELLDDGSLVYESDGALFMTRRSQTFDLGHGEAFAGGNSISPTLVGNGGPTTGMGGVRVFSQVGGNNDASGEKNAGGEALCLLSDGSATAVWRLDRTYDLPGREELPDDAAAALSGRALRRSGSGTYLLARQSDTDSLGVLDASTFELVRTIGLRDTVPSMASSIYDLAASPTDDLVYLLWTEYPTDKPSHDELRALDVSTGEVVGAARVENIRSQLEVFNGALRFVSHSADDYRLVTLDARTLEPRSETPLQIDAEYHSVDDVGTLVGPGGSDGPGSLRGESSETVLLVLDGAVAAFDPQTGERVETPLSGIAPEQVGVASSAAASIGFDPLYSQDRTAHLVFDENHECLLVGDASGNLTLFDGSGSALWQLSAATYGVPSFLMLLPSGQIFAQSGSSEDYMGQHLLIDGQTGSVTSSSDSASLIGDARPSRDGTRLIAQSKGYVMAQMSTSFVDGFSVICLEPESFGVESQMYLADAVSQDETRALFYDQVSERYFSLPLYSTDELVACARELVEGHELTGAERRLYHLE